MLTVTMIVDIAHVLPQHVTIHGANIIVTGFVLHSHFS